MTNIIATVKRSDGTIEEKELAGFTGMNKQIFANIKAATAKAGKGEVLKITYNQDRCNFAEIAKKHNDIYKEGHEGYQLTVEAAMKDPNYKEWVETVVFC